MNLEDARTVKGFALPTKFDQDGKPTTVFVPGHKCKTYFVEIDRKPDGLSLTCVETRHYDEELKRWVDTDQCCSGGMFGVCYHALAVVLHITEKLGKVEFYTKREEAEAKRGEGDKLISVWSNACPKPEKYVWLVFTPKARTPGAAVGKRRVG